MGSHLNADGKFQSDKYPTTPPDCVPLKVTDPTAQDLLWGYASRREPVDAEFSADLRSRLLAVGYKPPELQRVCCRCGKPGTHYEKDSTPRVWYCGRHGARAAHRGAHVLAAA